MFTLTVYDANHKVLDKWSEMTKLKLIGRLREDERFFKLGKYQRTFTFNNITYFEYANGAKAEIRVG